MLNEFKKFDSYSKLSDNNRTVIELILVELQKGNFNEVNSFAKLLDKSKFNISIHLNVFGCYTDERVNQVLRYLEDYLNYCDFDSVDKVIEFTGRVE